jgi:integrase/recombinase XerD
VGIGVSKAIDFYALSRGCFSESSIQCGRNSTTEKSVDFVHDTLRVREGKGKKERTIPLMPELKRALRRYVGDRDRQANIVDEETLFLARNGTSLNPSSIRKLVKKYYTKAGVRKAGVHTLRHTFSAHNVNNGMPIADLQKVLGHKKKETTLK